MSPYPTLSVSLMADIFICYRRNDSEGYAGRLHDHLVEHFGKRAVFVDVDNLHPGEDFEQIIQRTLLRSSIVLVLIGPRWIDHRLKNEDDYVRREIVAALKGKKRLIPLLVGDARMPSPDKLPPDLAPLVGKHAVALRHVAWKADVSRLVASLERTLARKKATASKTVTKPRTKSKQSKSTSTTSQDAGTTAPPRSTRKGPAASGSTVQKSAASRGKIGEQPSAAPDRGRAGKKAEQNRSADAASKSRSKPVKRTTRAETVSKVGAPSRSRTPQSQKDSAASAPRTGASGGSKAGAKTSPAGSRRRPSR